MQSRAWQICARRTCLVLATICLACGLATAQTTFFHSADTNHDWALDLNELLRVIQFFNAGGLHIQPGTEDGYAPGYVDALGGAEGDAPVHHGDYSPHNWQISLDEVLRAAQFFNVGGLAYADGTEDSYAPNPFRVPLTGDTDGDGLLDSEEVALGMDPSDADENLDGEPDGVALAKACAATFGGLPHYTYRGCDVPWIVCEPGGGAELIVPEGGCPPVVEVLRMLCVASYHPATGSRVRSDYHCLMIDCGEESYNIGESCLLFLEQGSFSSYTISCAEDCPDDFFMEHHACPWVWREDEISRSDVVRLVGLLGL